MEDADVEAEKNQTELNDIETPSFKSYEIPKTNGWSHLKNFMETLKCEHIIVPTRDKNNPSDNSFEDYFNSLWKKTSSNEGNWIFQNNKFEDKEYVSSLNSLFRFYPIHWNKILNRNRPGLRPVDDPDPKPSKKAYNIRGLPDYPPYLNTPPENIKPHSADWTSHQRITYHPVRPRKFDLNTTEKRFPPRNVRAESLYFIDFDLPNTQSIYLDKKNTSREDVKSFPTIQQVPDDANRNCTTSA